MRLKKWRLVVVATFIAFLLYHLVVVSQTSTDSEGWRRQSPRRSAVGSTSNSLQQLDLRRPVLAHVLAYQRTGSTFFSELFNDKPAVFFIYEPMDALYSAMYGTIPGLNVPSDIFTYPHGGGRILPEQEVTLQQWVLMSVYTCQMSNFPTAMMIHPFWHMFRRRMHVAEKYTSCMRALNRKNSDFQKYLENCQEPIRNICPKTFESRHPNITLCRDVLRFENEWTTLERYERFMAHWRTQLGKEVAGKFHLYFQCLASHQESTKTCSMQFDRLCLQRNVRMVKTVRSDMTIPGPLFVKFQNYRLIHFFRDPRGAVGSRLKPNNTWSLGIAEKGDPARAGEGYCNVIVRDYKTRVQLESEFPGRTFQVIFDEHTTNPEDSTNIINDYLHASDIKSARTWRNKSPLELQNANASEVAVKWQKTLGDDVVRTINQVCQEFFEIISSGWRDTGF